MHTLHIVLFPGPPCLCSKTSLPQRDIIPRWQGEWGADVRLFVAARVRLEKKKKKDDVGDEREKILLILAREGQAGSRQHGRRGVFRQGWDNG